MTLIADWLPALPPAPTCHAQKPLLGCLNVCLPWDTLSESQQAKPIPDCDSTHDLTHAAPAHQHGEEEGDDEVLPDQVLVRVQHNAADALQDQQPQQPPPARSTTPPCLSCGDLRRELPGHGAVQRGLRGGWRVRAAKIVSAHGCHVARITWQRIGSATPLLLWCAQRRVAPPRQICQTVVSSRSRSTQAGSRQNAAGMNINKPLRPCLS